MTPEQQKAIALAKARQRKAMAGAGQPTPVARELRTQGERQQYAREMLSQAFGDRPPLDEAFIGGLFMTDALRPSQLAGEVDLRQAEPGLSPAFMPEIITGVGGAALAVAGRNLSKSNVQQGWAKLMQPYQNRANQIKKELRGTTKTAGGTYKFRPGKAERQQIEVMQTIPGADPTKNFRDNLNAVNAELTNAGGKLQSRLAHSGANITETEVRAAVKKRIGDYVSSPKGVKLRGKKGKAMVEQYIDEVVNIYKKHPNSADGLWAARKEVDNLFRDLNGTRRAQMALGQGGLIPTREEMMWDNARKGMLDLLEKKVPGSQQDMRRLSIMYDARQTLAEKAPDVGETLIQRTRKSIGLDKPISLKPRNWKQ